MEPIKQQSEEQNIVLTNEYLIPKQAFLFFPTEKQFFHGDIPNQKTSKFEKKNYRKLYEGNLQLYPLERQKLQEFQDFLSKKNITLNGWWTEKRILRYLFGEKFKFEKSLEGILKHQEWIEKTLVPLKANWMQKYQEQEMLNSGLIYPFGKDHEFRPILIFNPEILDVSDENLIEKANNCMVYVLDYIVQNYMLPGQIETWIFVINLNKIGITSLPKAALKSIIANMSNNFNSRLGQMYIINAPKSISIPWTLFKPFIDKDTREKIKITGDSMNSDIYKHVNKDQLQKRHGGNQPDLEKGQYWFNFYNIRSIIIRPPTFPLNQNIQLPSSPSLKSVQEYQELYKSGQLNNNVVLQEYANGNQSNSQSEPKNSQGISYYLEYSSKKKY